MGDVVMLILALATAGAVGLLLFDTLRVHLPKRKRPLAGEDSELRTVISAHFRRRRVMSKAEFTLVKTIEELLRDRFPACRVLRGATLTDLITTEDDSAFDCISRKTVDLVVIDSTGLTLAAIDIHRTGIEDPTALVRDTAKREALRRARIEHVEVFDHHERGDIRRMVGDAIIISSGTAQWVPEKTLDAELEALASQPVPTPPTPPQAKAKATA
jgi:hypothetical protein